MTAKGRIGAILSHPKSREVIGVLLISLSILFLASLASFDPADPSFFHFRTAPGGQVKNLGGRVGAHLAGDLLELLGLSSFLLPLILFGLGCAVFRHRNLPLWGLKTAGVALLLLCLSLLASLLWSEVRLYGFHLSRPGGLVGQGLVAWLSPTLGTFGLYLSAATGFLVGLLLLSARSVGEIGSSLGKAIRSLGEIWKRRSKAKGREERVTVRPDRALQLEVAKEEARAMRPPLEERRVEVEGEAEERAQAVASFAGYRPPPLTLFQSPPPDAGGISAEELSSNSSILERKLRDFGLEGRVTAVHPGPVITRYELEPAPGIKVGRIVSLADDLALALKALSVRVVAPIPGKAVVGVEIPNQNRSMVFIREILSSPQFQNSPSWLTLALGKDIAGSPYVVDLVQMPHLLIGGATGAGKSVCINSLIVSMLCKASPEQVRFLLIDPKMVELSAYNGLPHLADEVVTDSREAARKLGQLVYHMEERYRLLASRGVRNIAAYNRLIEEEAEARGQDPATAISSTLPYLVVVIDELADLMMSSSAEVETAVTRLAQMARGVGIHLIMATQRPSVDVITGLIKANFPSRISFQVSSKTDSRTILDMNGAEQLLGNGDMLYLPSGSSKPIRIHGCYISEEEIASVVEFLRQEQGPWKRLDLFERREVREAAGEEEDGLYRQAVELVIATRQASISLIQRRLRVGYNRAARMIERMEEEGIVSPLESGKGREVLVRRGEEGWPHSA